MTNTLGNRFYSLIQLFFFFFFFVNEGYFIDKLLKQQGLLQK